MTNPDAEFVVMQGLVDLDDSARARVLAWAASRWTVAPAPEPAKPAPYGSRVRAALDILRAASAPVGTGEIRRQLGMRAPDATALMSRLGATGRALKVGSRPAGSGGFTETLWVIPGAK